MTAAHNLTVPRSTHVSSSEKHLVMCSVEAEVRQDLSTGNFTFCSSLSLSLKT